MDHILRGLITFPFCNANIISLVLAATDHVGNNSSNPRTICLPFFTIAILI